ncbi:MAG: hypothetical protein LBP51_04045 [Deferribacteraceae bacterium]|jgi:hypothetical protein|nr:hypothetical protein [Deferribacteraceae bacterium]
MKPSIFDLIVEAHIGLERQGPGSSETTIKALTFLDNLDKDIKAADLAWKYYRLRLLS